MPTIGQIGQGRVPDQKTRTAPTSTVYGVPVLERQKAVVARHGEKLVIRWQMVDDEGRAVDLTA